ncbi:MAG TPA: cbb3-type cytochrome c oxidase subunit I, partial [Bacteroidia bacterium]|nr:cbb3-type cytochrome c oxidase subunit I [Bacteroidia bacterium]
MKKNIGTLFILAGLIALVLGLLTGVAGALQFVFPEGNFNTYFPFFKTRPMHVSLVLSWIVLTAAGGIYFYLPKIAGRELFSKSLAD